MLIIIILAFIAGAITMICLQILWLNNKFCKDAAPDKRKMSQYDSFQLPQELSKLILNPERKTKKESCLFMNLISQFLFRELKDTKKVRKWFLKKLNNEFDELLQTTSGKLLDQITVEEINLGTMFPVIHSVQVKHVLTSDDDQSIEELDMCFDLDYRGGFHLAVQTDLVFGRSAYLSVKVVRLKGLLRVQLTRLPFTHWSISFYDEPVVEFDVESRFEGHVITQLTSLIINQIRRSIRKKHTLPNYKMRFKPFFTPPELPSDMKHLQFHGHTIGQGRFNVCIVECSRLIKVPPESLLYCTINIGSLPWLDQAPVRGSYVSNDIEIHRSLEESFGVVFKEEFVLERLEAVVIVDSVLPDSPAANADVIKRDIVLSLNGQRVTTSKQATKLLESSHDRLTMRIDRIVFARKDCKYEEDLIDFAGEVPKTSDIEDEFVNISIMMSQSISKKVVNGTSRKSSLQGSPELTKRDVSPSEHNETIKAPSPALRRRKVSPPYTPERTAEGKVDPGESVMDSMRGEAQLRDEVDEGDSETDMDDDDDVDIRKTSFVQAATNPLWNEKFEFTVDDTNSDITVCVWCKTIERTDKNDKTSKRTQDFLLGHIKLALCDVALECLSTLQCDVQKTLHLSPSDAKTGSKNMKVPNLSSHSGFDARLCYGDITLDISHIAESLPVAVRKRLTKDPYMEQTTHTLFSMTVDTPDVVLVYNYMPHPRLKGQHMFLGTHFSSATYCNFCGKKIWLKVAYQCTVCKMICHKKCTEKCRQQTLCTKEGVKQRQDVESSWEGPVDARKPEGNKDGTSALLQKFKRDFPNLKQLSLGKAKDSASTEGNIPSELTPPVNHRQRRNSAPEDKPDGPHVTDSNLLAVDGIPRARSSTSLHTLIDSDMSSHPSTDELLKNLEKLSDDDTVSFVPHALVQVAQSRLAGTVNEIMVTSAKQKGRELYSDLSMDERKSKLDAMVTKLQQEIDIESEHRADLWRSEADTTEPRPRQRLQTQVNKSEERLQALMVLMVHYCAGLQHCLDLEQQLREPTASETPMVTPKPRSRHWSNKQRSLRRRKTSDRDSSYSELTDSV